MNELVLPSAPNWYNTSAVVCSPEGHLIYASRRDIVILTPAPVTEANNVSFIHDAHNDRVLSVNANMVTWGHPSKQIVSVGEDKKVKLWDFETKKKIMCHTAHESNNSPIVAASFAGERVISVTENGQIVLWRLVSDTTQDIVNLFDKRTKVMCMATCPHATFLTAFGLTTGLVIVADLRKKGRVMFRMREHDHDITGLSWCPTPYNIYHTESGLQLMNTIKKRLYRPQMTADNKKEEDSRSMEEECKSLGDESKSNEEDNKSRESGSLVDFPQLASDEKIDEKQPLNDENINKETEITQNITPDDIEPKSVDVKNENELIQKPFTEAIENLEKPNVTNDTSVEEKNDDQEKKDNTVIDNIKDFLADSPTRNEDIVDVPEKITEYPERMRPVVDKKNPWGNIVFNDSDDDVNKSENKEVEKSDNDFLKECLNLQQLIKKANDDSENKQSDCDENKENVINETPKKSTEIHKADESTKHQYIILKNDDDEHKVSEKNVSTQLKSENNLTDMMSDLILSEKPQNVHLNSDLSESESHKEEATNSSYRNDDKTWRNVPYVLNLNLPDTVSSTEFLLASSCRAGFINIWRAGTDGRLEVQLKKHMKTQQSNKKRINKQNWISLCWIQPTLILSSSIWHELLAWDLMPKPNKSNKYILNSSLIHADHKKYIFTISTAFELFATPADENWRNNKQLCVWTTSLDRWLLCTNLSTRCNTCCYVTFGGIINCLSVSQLDPNRIALSCGDGSIRIWDLSRPHLQNITMTSFFDKVHTKATSIDWHPVKENCIAFSTCEGRVGEYDINNRTKTAVIYSNYHRNLVYKIQWGPLPNSENSDIHGLYSCSVGTLIVHDSMRPNKEPEEIKIFDEDHVTVFSWKTDYSILAVGSKTGSVALVNKKFELVQTLYMQKKSVRCLEWHPLATSYDNGFSEFSNYLAVATNESSIYVYDCSKEDSDLNTQNAVVLEGHKNAVRCLGWCPHIGGRLVSSCEEGLAIVWDIKSQTILSTYHSQYDIGPVLVWSPLDADLIILGGKTLIIWRITKNPPNLNAVITRKERFHKKEAKSSDVKNKMKPVKEVKRNILWKMNKYVNNADLAIASCRKLLEKAEENVENKSADHIVTVNSDSDSDNFEDAEENQDLDDSVIDPVKLFGNRKDILSLINYEQQHQKDQVSKTHLSLWRGDITATIKDAIDKNRLTPWIINLAPMVSHKLWQECCEKYANFLCDENSHLEASSYFLACHKVEDAIFTLVKGGYVKEALALAKARLPENSPTIPQVVEHLIKKTRHDGILEFTALCYIHLGKLNEAAEILKNRDYAGALELAADISKNIDNKDLLDVIELKLNGSEKSGTVQMEGINILESRLDAILLKNQQEEEEEEEEESKP